MWHPLFLISLMAFFSLGCGRIVEPHPGNSQLYLRGYSSAALAFATMPSNRVVRPTPREAETPSQASPIVEGLNPEPMPEADLPPKLADPETGQQEVVPSGDVVSERPPVEESAARLPEFVPREAPPSAKRQIWYFGGEWCGPCRPTKAELLRIAQARNLILRKSTDTTAKEADIVLYEVDRHGRLEGKTDPPVDVPRSPLIVLVDAQGKEIQRIEGRATLEQIEDLWLSGPKREHGLDGLPIDFPRLERNASAAGINLQTDWASLIGTTKAVSTRAEDVSIPIPEVGEVVIPRSVSITASSWEGGVRVSVDSGTPCPFVKSKWLGNLYPVPITAICLTPTLAKVELRGWKDINVEFNK